MSKVFKIGVIGLFALFLSCDKSGEFSTSIEGGTYSGTITEEGTYSGTITVKYLGDMPPKSWWGGGSGKTTLELMDGKFTCRYSNGIPGGGSGNYSINDNKITFNDENGWLANFDGGLILNGEYNFTFGGEKIKFSKSYDGYAHYIYDLKRQ